MSRAYRITVKASETRELRGSDEICTPIELLPILSPEAMAKLLKDELERGGFTEGEDGKLVRTDGKVTVTVDPCNGEVSVKSESKEDVKIEATKEATGWDDAGPNPEDARARANEQLKAEIDKRADRETQRLQSEASAALEKHLEDLQPELNNIVNKVTREALKEKAKQLGAVKEISEDAETGNMTITIEV